MGYNTYKRPIQAAVMVVKVDGWSVSAQYRKCGKSTCKICRGEKGHGPYYYGTRVVNGKREIRYFGKTLPSTSTQTSIQESIQPLVNPPQLTLDDHIQALIDAAGSTHWITLRNVRRDILHDLYVPEHTRMFLVEKEKGLRKTEIAVHSATYVLPSDYVVRAGKMFWHFRNLTSVEFAYQRGSTDLTMTIHHAGDAKTFIFRGLDVVKMVNFLVAKQK